MRRFASKDGVDEVLRNVTNETLDVGERDIEGFDEVARVVGDDLNTVALPDDE